MEKQEAKIDATPTVDSGEATNQVANTATTDAPAGATQSTGPATRFGGPRGQGGRGGRGGESNDRRNPRRPRRGAGGRGERARPEFEQKIISIRRVTRVMGGGRRFSFSVSMVIGDKKGRVGVGIGKAGDTQLAIEKAVRDARKHMITVPMNEHSHIAHDVEKKLSSSRVMIMPAPGRGLVAGSSARTVLELAGVKDVTAKLLSRTKNKLNNARATVEALKQLKA
ncbi:30S ribosomal protein S5 [Candidatus Kaiserbacteria bacterium CG10_big_fil_rev_8_21_14_0_10_44_10]|uniref:Small ribosomal subunit protein uS5 n=1 Tax=Candidatus Kaiserbacteria bacterium CG10_big_fil_rev_8_21_14_0_10_44_10 TaxID=1974606 RepID=A0A2H0UH71_9BACT|nr:MAG: 30S ribosomal protein S5 [Candidatus Kaiserbacteria bacterium CG10_big_fil_rev_8_21_14_0_10_44_10]